MTGTKERKSFRNWLNSKFNILQHISHFTKQTKTAMTDKIKQAITDFVKGGDNSDTKLLDKVLHKDFRVTSNHFMGTPGVTVIEREKYLANVRDGVFGGLPRIMTIENIDVSETIASVKLRLESAENHFISYNTLVLDTDNEWKIINNLAVVSQKARL